MAPRRKNDEPHFSVHDFEGARPRIVPVNADGQEREKDNFGAEQQRVGKKRWVRMHIRARLQRRFPYGIRLCICCQLQRHIAVGGNYLNKACGMREDKSAAEVLICVCDDTYVEAKVQRCRGSIHLRRS